MRVLTLQKFYRIQNCTYIFLQIQYGIKSLAANTSTISQKQNLLKTINKKKLKKKIIKI